MRALAYESRDCKAIRYVLVLRRDLQPMQAEWEDIALRWQESRLECVNGRAGTKPSAKPTMAQASAETNAVFLWALTPAREIDGRHRFFSLDSAGDLRHH
jgi:hypothetical protein